MTEQEFKTKLVQSIVNYFLDMRNQCLDEIAKKRADPNLATAIIRKYNRDWNTRADSLGLKILEKDDFILFFKKHLEKLDLPEEYKNAFRYL